MRQAEIPFPEEAIKEYSELEELLLGNPDELNPLKFGSLPRKIHSAAIDTYANWVGAQHFFGENRERFSRVYLGLSPLSVVPYFPSAVTAGHERGVGFTPFEEEDWTKQQPVVDIHTHPGYSIPLHSDEDMEIFLDHLNVAAAKTDRPPKIASMVVGPEFNALLIATRDTRTVPGVKSKLEVRTLRAQVNEAAHLVGQDLEVLKSSLRQTGKDEKLVVDEIKSFERAILGSWGHTNLLTGHFMNAEIARKFSLGFYIAGNDGNYFLNGEGLDRFPENIFRQVLTRLLVRYQVEDLPGANFVAKLDQRLMESSIRARAQSLGLYIPSRNGLIL
jgi:hypothetical protein